MSLQAYKTAAERAESPRETEYRLFGEVTRALMSAAATDPADVKTRIAALDWNRRLWGALAADCASEGNGLPEGVRAQIITLSLWVNRHTSAVVRRQESIQPLIEVNRSIMQGLRAQPEAA
jgi:flagellar protein FlaF